MREVIFVFAHQDDEVGACPTLIREIRAGSRVWCAFLTDGAAGTQATVRDAESTKFLGSLGIAPTMIGFLRDNEGRIDDGRLVEDLDRAQSALSTFVRVHRIVPQCIYTTDWEGGHVDHDAAYLIALAAAEEFACRLYTFSLYNGYRRLPGFFRVSHFVPDEQPTRCFPLSWPEASVAAAAPLAFPSQRRTWFALAPGLILRILSGRREGIRRGTVRRIERTPHPGKLLYETLFGYPAAKFMATSYRYRMNLLLMQSRVGDGTC